MNFQSKKPKYEILRKKWGLKHKVRQEKFWEKHGSHLDLLAKTLPTRQLLVGGLGSLMMLTTPTSFALPSGHLLPGDSITKEEDKNLELAGKLKKMIPMEVRPLNQNEEEEITKILSTSFNFNVKADINGIRLSRNFGLIGGEQHLYRYPGDNLLKHADNASDWAMYGSSGIAPHLGAWGYFGSSNAEFTQRDKLRERYYLAIQTFLAPGFSENVERYRDFFKFRKMLVINPETGQAVVAVVGDAGPAEWTGKHLGGSPEVMHFLGLAKGPRKGPVLFFFIDDNEDRVPLGPVRVSNIES